MYKRQVQSIIRRIFEEFVKNGGGVNGMDDYSEALRILNQRLASLGWKIPGGVTSGNYKVVQQRLLEKLGGKLMTRELFDLAMTSYSSMILEKQSRARQTTEKGFLGIGRPTYLYLEHGTDIKAAKAKAEEYRKFLNLMAENHMTTMMDDLAVHAVRGAEENSKKVAQKHSDRKMNENVAALNNADIAIRDALRENVGSFLSVAERDLFTNPLDHVTKNSSLTADQKQEIAKKMLSDFADSRDGKTKEELVMEMALLLETLQDGDVLLSQAVEDELRRLLQDGHEYVKEILAMVYAGSATAINAISYLGTIKGIMPDATLENSLGESPGLLGRVDNILKSRTNVDKQARAFEGGYFSSLLGRSMNLGRFLFSLTAGSIAYSLGYLSPSFIRQHPVKSLFIGLGLFGVGAVVFLALPSITLAVSVALGAGLFAGGIAFSRSKTTVKTLKADRLTDSYAKMRSSQATLMSEPAVAEKNVQYQNSVEDAKELPSVLINLMRENGIDLTALDAPARMESAVTPSASEDAAASADASVADTVAAERAETATTEQTRVVDVSKDGRRVIRVNAPGAPGSAGTAAAIRNGLLASEFMAMAQDCGDAESCKGLTVEIYYNGTETIRFVVENDAHRLALARNTPSEILVGAATGHVSVISSEGIDFVVAKENVSGTAGVLVVRHQKLSVEARRMIDAAHREREKGISNADLEHRDNKQYKMKNVDSQQGLFEWVTINGKTALVHKDSVQTVLRNGVELGEGAVIGKSVTFGREVIIGANTVISNGAILEDEVKLGDNNFLDEGTVIQKGVTTAANNRFLGNQVDPNNRERRRSTTVRAGTQIGENNTFLGSLIGVNVLNNYIVVNSVLQASDISGESSLLANPAGDIISGINSGELYKRGAKGFFSLDKHKNVFDAPSISGRRVIYQNGSRYGFGSMSYDKYIDLGSDLYDSQESVPETFFGRLGFVIRMMFKQLWKKGADKFAIDELDAVKAQKKIDREIIVMGTALKNFNSKAARAKAALKLDKESHDAKKKHLEEFRQKIAESTAAGSAVSDTDRNLLNQLQTELGDWKITLDAARLDTYKQELARLNANPAPDQKVKDRIAELRRLTGELTSDILETADRLRLELRNLQSKSASSAEDLGRLAELSDLLGYADYREQLEARYDLIAGGGIDTVADGLSFQAIARILGRGELREFQELVNDARATYDSQMKQESFAKWKKRILVGAAVIGFAAVAVLFAPAVGAAGLLTASAWVVPGLLTTLSMFFAPRWVNYASIGLLTSLTVLAFFAMPAMLPLAYVVLASAAIAPVMISFFTVYGSTLSYYFAASKESIGHHFSKLKESVSGIYKSWTEGMESRTKKIVGILALGGIGAPLMHGASSFIISATGFSLEAFVTAALPGTAAAAAPFLAMALPAVLFAGVFFLMRYLNKQDMAKEVRVSPVPAASGRIEIGGRIYTFKIETTSEGKKLTSLTSPEGKVYTLGKGPLELQTADLPEGSFNIGIDKDTVRFDGVTARHPSDSLMRRITGAVKSAWRNRSTNAKLEWMRTKVSQFMAEEPTSVWLRARIDLAPDNKPSAEKINHLMTMIKAKEKELEISANKKHLDKLNEKLADEKRSLSKEYKDLDQIIKKFTDSLSKNKAEFLAELSGEGCDEACISRIDSYLKAQKEIEKLTEGAASKSLKKEDVLSSLEEDMLDAYINVLRDRKIIEGDLEAARKHLAKEDARKKLFENDPIESTLGAEALKKLAEKHKIGIETVLNMIRGGWGHREAQWIVTASKYDRRDLVQRFNARTKALEAALSDEAIEAEKAKNPAGFDEKAYRTAKIAELEIMSELKTRVLGILSRNDITRQGMLRELTYLLDGEETKQSIKDRGIIVASRTVDLTVPAIAPIELQNVIPLIFANLIVDKDATIEGMVNIGDTIETLEKLTLQGGHANVDALPIAQIARVLNGKGVDLEDISEGAFSAVGLEPLLASFNKGSGKLSDSDAASMTNVIDLIDGKDNEAARILEDGMSMNVFGKGIEITTEQIISVYKRRIEQLMEVPGSSAKLAALRRGLALYHLKSARELKKQKETEFKALRKVSPAEAEEIIARETEVLNEALLGILDAAMAAFPGMRQKVLGFAKKNGLAYTTSMLKKFRDTLVTESDVILRNPDAPEAFKEMVRAMLPFLKANIDIEIEAGKDTMASVKGNKIYFGSDAMNDFLEIRFSGLVGANPARAVELYVNQYFLHEMTEYGLNEFAQGMRVGSDHKSVFEHRIKTVREEAAKATGKEREVLLAKAEYLKSFGNIALRLLDEKMITGRVAGSDDPFKMFRDYFAEYMASAFVKYYGNRDDQTMVAQVFYTESLRKEHWNYRDKMVFKQRVFQERAGEDPFERFLQGDPNAWEVYIDYFRDNIAYKWIEDIEGSILNGQVEKAEKALTKLKQESDKQFAQTKEPKISNAVYFKYRKIILQSKRGDLAGAQEQIRTDRYNLNNDLSYVGMAYADRNRQTVDDNFVPPAEKFNQHGINESARMTAAIEGYDPGRISKDEIAERFIERENRVLDLMRKGDEASLKAAEEEMRNLLPPSHLAWMDDAKSTLAAADTKSAFKSVGFWLSEALVLGLAIYTFLMLGILFAAPFITVAIAVHFFWPGSGIDKSMLQYSDNLSKRNGRSKTDNIKFLAENRYRTLLLAAVSQLVHRTHEAREAEEILRSLRESMAANSRIADLAAIEKLNASGERDRNEAFDYLVKNQNHEEQIKLDASMRDSFDGAKVSTLYGLPVVVMKRDKFKALAQKQGLEGRGEVTEMVVPFGLQAGFSSLIIVPEDPFHDEGFDISAIRGKAFKASQKHLWPNSENEMLIQDYGSRSYLLSPIQAAFERDGYVRAGQQLMSGFGAELEKLRHDERIYEPGTYKVKDASALAREMKRIVKSYRKELVNHARFSKEPMYAGRFPAPFGLDSSDPNAWDVLDQFETMVTTAYQVETARSELRDPIALLARSSDLAAYQHLLSKALEGAGSLLNMDEAAAAIENVEIGMAHKIARDRGRALKEVLAERAEWKSMDQERGDIVRDSQALTAAFYSGLGKNKSLREKMLEDLKYFRGNNDVAAVGYPDLKEHHLADAEVHLVKFADIGLAGHAETYLDGMLPEAFIVVIPEEKWNAFEKATGHSGSDGFNEGIERFTGGRFGRSGVIFIKGNNKEPEGYSASTVAHEVIHLADPLTPESIKAYYIKMGMTGHKGWIAETEMIRELKAYWSHRANSENKWEVIKTDLSGFKKTGAGNYLDQYYNDEKIPESERAAFRAKHVAMLERMQIELQKLELLIGEHATARLMRGVRTPEELTAAVYAAFQANRDRKVERKINAYHPAKDEDGRVFEVLMQKIKQNAPGSLGFEKSYKRARTTRLFKRIIARAAKLAAHNPLLAEKYMDRIAVHLKSQDGMIYTAALRSLFKAADQSFIEEYLMKKLGIENRATIKDLLAANKDRQDRNSELTRLKTEERTQTAAFQSAGPVQAARIEVKLIQIRNQISVLERENKANVILGLNEGEFGRIAARIEEPSEEDLESFKRLGQAFAVTKRGDGDTASYYLTLLRKGVQVPAFGNGKVLFSFDPSKDLYTGPIDPTDASIKKQVLDISKKTAEKYKVIEFGTGSYDKVLANDTEQLSTVIMKNGEVYAFNLASRLKHAEGIVWYEEGINEAPEGSLYRNADEQDKDPEAAYISNIMVDETKRGGGLMTSLLHDLASKMLAGGQPSRRVVLDAEIKEPTLDDEAFNQLSMVAHNIYRDRYGFKIVGAIEEDGRRYLRYSIDAADLLSRTMPKAKTPADLAEDAEEARSELRDAVYVEKEIKFEAPVETVGAPGPPPALDKAVAAAEEESMSYDAKVARLTETIAGSGGFGDAGFDTERKKIAQLLLSVASLDKDDELTDESILAMLIQQGAVRLQLDLNNPLLGDKKVAYARHLGNGETEIVMSVEKLLYTRHSFDQEIDARIKAASLRTWIRHELSHAERHDEIHVDFKAQISARNIDLDRTRILDIVDEMQAYTGTVKDLDVLISGAAAELETASGKEAAAISEMINHFEIRRDNIQNMLYVATGQRFDSIEEAVNQKNFAGIADWVMAIQAEVGGIHPIQASLIGQPAAEIMNINFKPTAVLAGAFDQNWALVAKYFYGDIVKMAETAAKLKNMTALPASEQGFMAAAVLDSDALMTDAVKQGAGKTWLGLLAFQPEAEKVALLKEIEKQVRHTVTMAYIGVENVPPFFFAQLGLKGPVEMIPLKDAGAQLSELMQIAETVEASA